MAAPPPSDLEREQIFSMAEKEMEYRVEMFNKYTVGRWRGRPVVNGVNLLKLVRVRSGLTHTCFKKCIENKYKDSELNMGENSCIDRCVSKYWQVTNLVGTLLGNTRPM